VSEDAKLKSGWFVVDFRSASFGAHGEKADAGVHILLFSRLFSLGTWASRLGAGDYEIDPRKKELVVLHS
jgi:hypothetical protein